MAMELGAGRAVDWESDRLEMTDQIATHHHGPASGKVSSPPEKESIWIKCRPSHIRLSRRTGAHSARSPRSVPEVFGLPGQSVHPDLVPPAPRPDRPA